MTSVLDKAEEVSRLGPLSILGTHLLGKKQSAFVCSHTTNAIVVPVSPFISQSLLRSIMAEMATSMPR